MEIFKKRNILPMERWKFVFYTLAAYLLIPVILLTAKSRQGKNWRQTQNPKILVVPILTRVGDLVCATSVFRAIKIHYPKSNLSVLIGNKVVDLLQTNNRYDQIININDVQFKGFWGRGRLFKFIFDQKFDAVISLTNNPFNNLINWFSAAPLRVKTAAERRSSAELLTDIFSNKKLLYKTGTFLQDHYIRLLSFVSIPFSPPVKELITTDGGNERVKKYLESLGLDPAELIVGVTPSAGHKAKEWPPERFSAVVGELIKKYNAAAIIIDSPSNERTVDAVINSLPQDLKSRAFKAINFSLSDLPSLIKRLKAFIAVDTGSIYIAHTLGVPLIDITGPVDPNDQPPNDTRSVQVRPPDNLRPVFSVLASPDKAAYERAPELVAAITPQDVIRAFEVLVKRGVVKI